MLKKKKILDFEKRKEIYNLILENPGLHLRELERKLNFSFGALRYHLNYMMKRGLITKQHDRGFLRYFVSENVGNGDKDLLSAFRQPVLRKMFLVFLLCPDKKVFFKEDFKDIPFIRKWYNAGKWVVSKHRTTLEFHLKKLVENNILQPVKIKRKVGYIFVKDEEEILDFLIKYNQALPYKEVDGLVYWANRLIIPNITDPIMDSILEIFPHPYHA